MGARLRSSVLRCCTRIPSDSVYFCCCFVRRDYYHDHFSLCRGADMLYVSAAENLLARSLLFQTIHSKLYIVTCLVMVESR